MTVPIFRNNGGRLLEVHTPTEAGQVGQVVSSAELLRQQGVPIEYPGVLPHLLQPRDETGRWM